MLIEDEKVIVVIESAQDETFVELSDNSKLLEITLSKHLRKFSFTDLYIVCIFAIFFNLGTNLLLLNF